MPAQLFPKEEINRPAYLFCFYLLFCGYQEDSFLPCLVFFANIGKFFAFFTLLFCGYRGAFYCLLRDITIDMSITARLCKKLISCIKIKIELIENFLLFRLKTCFFQTFVYFSYGIYTSNGKCVFKLK